MHKRLRRGLWIVLAVILTLGVVFGILWATPVMKVQQFDIQGWSQQPVEDIEEASAIHAGDNLLRVNQRGAAAQISTLPWIESATVAVSWPDTVRITVVERTPRLFADRNDGPHLVDEHGYPFVIQTPPPGVVKVTGTSEDDQALFQSILEVLDSIDESSRKRITEVDAANNLELSMVLDNGNRVYWGSTENMHDKAVAFRTAVTRPEAHLDISGAPIIAVRP